MSVRLETDRLTLRALREADAPRLATLANDEDIARMTAMIPHPYPVELAEGWILIQRARIAAGREFNLVIDAQGEGLVGKIGLFRRTSTADWELGYWVGRPYWGRGYATEAVAAATAFAHDELGTNPLKAGYFEGNDASRRVLERNGFTSTGKRWPLYSLARDTRTTVIGMAHAAPAPHSAVRDQACVAKVG